jgi:cell division protein FtsQ
VWDNPRLLNGVAGFLTGVATLALAIGALELLLASPLFPLREVRVLGALERVSREEIEAATRGRLRGNFFAVRLSEVRAGLESLPWVRSVDVRRVWPDRLEVGLQEHVALARWGERELLSVEGERFAAQADAQLAVFAGPAGSERELARRYRRFAEFLAPLGAGIERVVLTPRLAWQLKLDNGLYILLGRDSSSERVEARLERFVAAYPATLARIARRHEYVDLRYPNGFALRIKDLGGQ